MNARLQSWIHAWKSHTFCFLSNHVVSKAAIAMNSSEIMYLYIHRKWQAVTYPWCMIDVTSFSDSPQMSCKQAWKSSVSAASPILYFRVIVIGFIIKSIGFLLVQHNSSCPSLSATLSGWWWADGIALATVVVVLWCLNCRSNVYFFIWLDDSEILFFF